MIVLRAKAIDFKVTYINLKEKPDWFLKISPHAKVPVLVVDEQPLFESNAIAEYLDEAVSPQLQPADPLKRARNRAWTDFIPDFSADLGAVYYADSKEKLEAGMAKARDGLAKLETALAEERGNDGPYFNGEELSLVDAAYAPFLMRFRMVEQKLGTGLLDDFPLVAAWVEALGRSDAVTGSVAESFGEKFVGNLKDRNALSAPLFAA